MNPLDSTFVPAADGFFFANAAAASAAMAVVQWTPPADHTLPQTVDEEKRYVRLLVDAFQSLETANEKEGSAYRKRFSEGFYQDWMVEARAWDIVRIAKRLHTEGFKAHIYDIALLGLVAKTKEWTFAQRIDTLCSVLKLSKAVAVSVMKDEKTMTAIGAPDKLLSATVTNHRSNEARNRWVKEGRTRDGGNKRKKKGGEEDATAEYDPYKAMGAVAWDLATDLLVSDAIATVNASTFSSATAATPAPDTA